MIKNTYFCHRELHLQEFQFLISVGERPLLSDFLSSGKSQNLGKSQCDLEVGPPSQKIPGSAIDL